MGLILECSHSTHALTLKSLSKLALEMAHEVLQALLGGCVVSAAYTDSQFI